MRWQGVSATVAPPLCRPERATRRRRRFPGYCLPASRPPHALTYQYLAIKAASAYTLLASLPTLRKLEAARDPANPATVRPLAPPRAAADALLTRERCTC